MAEINQDAIEKLYGKEKYKTYLIHFISTHKLCPICGEPYKEKIIPEDANGYVAKRSTTLIYCLKCDAIFVEAHFTPFSRNRECSYIIYENVDDFINDTYPKVSEFVKDPFSTVAERRKKNLGEWRR